MRDRLADLNSQTRFCEDAGFSDPRFTYPTPTQSFGSSPLSAEYLLRGHVECLHRESPGSRVGCRRFYRALVSPTCKIFVNSQLSNLQSTSVKYSNIPSTSKSTITMAPCSCSSCTNCAGNCSGCSCSSCGVSSFHLRK
ncbi:hypothetical protein EJ08DRAFT_85290 [Tothia fuscella]|uniref:Metallothionein n=1 Tax=Tothia fuscella TaxID=1048955 RepID=A0A9P4NEM3_9PEZI|nr:hypothetical protein EJ08DRAFT_85290 [Tothia fuscella]